MVRGRDPTFYFPHVDNPLSLYNLRGKISHEKILVWFYYLFNSLKLSWGLFPVLQMKISLCIMLFYFFRDSTRKSLWSVFNSLSNWIKNGYRIQHLPVCISVPRSLELRYQQTPGLGILWWGWCYYCVFLCETSGVQCELAPSIIINDSFLLIIKPGCHKTFSVKCGE